MNFLRTTSVELVKCPHCGNQHWYKSSSLWQCGNGHILKTSNGLPDFTQGLDVSNRDLSLQKKIYNGLFGQYYDFMWPLLSMPARPVRQSVPQWITFFTGWAVVILISGGWAVSLSEGLGYSTVFFTLALAGLVLFFNRHRYLFWLLLLAIPVKITLMLRTYRPAETFPDIHHRWVKTMLESGCENVLDISTGTCNSLLRHGWSKLDADFFGVDLSPVMLRQGADNASRANIAVNLYIADAQALPIADESMDLVLNYGALNAYNDQKQALSEMARVLKPGGILVCLDEQLYRAATPLESLYFSLLLSSHDNIDRFPDAAVPTNLSVVENHQIYQFYYLAVLRKQCNEK